MITPFTQRGDLDLEATERLVEKQIAGGVDGILVLGTTGEAPALSAGERRTLLEAVREMSRGRCALMAGTGTNNTLMSLEFTRQAVEAGYDYVLVVTPYYNKPTQQGLYQHYSLIASEAPEAKIVVYNVPGRTGVNILPDTVVRLFEDHENIVAIKEASGKLDQVSQLVGRGVPVMSGDDALTLPMLSLGATGVISVASNIVPGMVSQMVKAALDGDFAQAREVHHRLFPLFKALFVETNPGPVKAAAGLLGLCDPYPRPPLAQVEANTVDLLRDVLTQLGLLSN